MTPDLNDTIVALATPAGAGARAIIRLSGPAAHRVAKGAFTKLPTDSQSMVGELSLPGLIATLPADLHLWNAPKSYTGQDMTEIHCLSSGPLIELVITGLLRGGARSAQPGEFTLRAFLAGKLDLPRAEAVLGVIEARDSGELQQALAQLAGNLTQPLNRLRDDLLNLLADVEAGLDFGDEDIRFVNPDELLGRLAAGMAHLVLLQRQLQQRTLSDQPFRVVLAGEPNVGKSSLFNALTAEEGALVSPTPGTTRDYLTRKLIWEGVTIELIDTAGWQEASDQLKEQAQRLGTDQAMKADLVLLCAEAGGEAIPGVRSGVSSSLLVATKCDLGIAPPDYLATSAVSGRGLQELRQRILQHARSRKQSPLAPSVSRCRHHVETCLAHLRHAHEFVLNEDPPELLALELRGALDQLGEMVGAVFTDDLLDRVFSRFCIGK